MIIKDLIAELQRYPDDTDVTHRAEDSGLRSIESVIVESTEFNPWSDGVWVGKYTRVNDGKVKVIELN